MVWNTSWRAVSCLLSSLSFLFFSLPCSIFRRRSRVGHCFVDFRRIERGGYSTLLDGHGFGAISPDRSLMGLKSPSSAGGRYGHYFVKFLELCPCIFSMTRKDHRSVHWGSFHWPDSSWSRSRWQKVVASFCSGIWGSRRVPTSIPRWNASVEC